MSEPVASPLGLIYLPSSGTGVGQFSFIVDPDEGAAVEIGTPVAADTVEGTVVGVVTDMSTVGTSNDPVRDEMGSSFDSSYVEKIPEVLLATVQVYSSQLMRPVRAGIVRAATKEELLIATGINQISWPIPAGVLDLPDGDFAKVCLDGENLVGPSAAHLVVNGLSGSASKTSFTSVLLRSVLASSGDPGQKVAALIFNVKGDDLVYLDQEPAAGYELTDDDLAMYEALGVPAAPFDDVEVWSPALPGGVGSQSRRDDAQILRWDLSDIWEYKQHLFPYIYDDEKLLSFFADFEDQHIRTADPRQRIETFAQLHRWFDGIMAEAAESGTVTPWRTHHIATLRRVRRMLSGLVPRCKGLLSQEKTAASEDIDVKSFRHGQVVVLDIAGLRTDVQAIVIARTLDRVLREAEDGDLGVDNLVVFADELNQWAPSQGGEMASVRKLLQRISTQGRYAGISLWGACQKMSKIDELVRDNAATRAVGITADGELATGVYGRLSSGLTERLATLPRGSMALWHYSFRGAMVVKFPRPAWRTGKAKEAKVRATPVDTLDVSDKGLERLMEGIAPDQAEAIIAAADDPERAKEDLLAVRQPDMAKTAIHEPNTVDPSDPFGIHED